MPANSYIMAAQRPKRNNSPINLKHQPLKATVPLSSLVRNTSPTRRRTSPSSPGLPIDKRNKYRRSPDVNNSGTSESRNLFSPLGSKGNFQNYMNYIYFSFFQLILKLKSLSLLINLHGSLCWNLRKVFIWKSVHKFIYFWKSSLFKSTILIFDNILHLLKIITMHYYYYNWIFMETFYSF